MISHATDNEIEQERQEYLKDLEEEQKFNKEAIDSSDWEPGTLGCHEALHTAAMLLDNIDGFLMHHPSVVNNEEFFREAYKAHESLANLYYKIAEAHLSEGEDKA
ncbi:MAG: hypothetical protein ACRBBN_12420 [Methyloligellaceae bacterium]